MQDLKLNLATFVTIDGFTEKMRDFGEMFTTLNIPDTAEYHEARVSIVQKLLVFGKIDLSPAYPGHSAEVYLEYEED